MKKAIVIIALLSLSLIGVECLMVEMSHRVKSGEVYDMEYIPEQHTTELLPTIIDGYYAFIPMRNSQDEEWIIRIRAWDDEKSTWVTSAYRVSEADYNVLAIGDYVAITGEKGNVFTIRIEDAVQKGAI